MAISKETQNSRKIKIEYQSVNTQELPRKLTRHNKWRNTKITER
jgi:hypothetical protein